ncbi:hypothetical protein [Haloferax larsenii]|uniref:Uncharacterized protein n=1 Tax=Haloferax larsenii TaxID=302484 RepID=A0A1H7T6H5_HALLR|nr:hypothetical protein [Haloferax larsenii]SEL80502.1 hypothetical protein SAMN04488691_10895 [Haloferax larsenii]
MNRRELLSGIGGVVTGAAMVQYWNSGANILQRDHKVTVLNLSSHYIDCFISITDKSETDIFWTRFTSESGTAGIQSDSIGGAPSEIYLAVNNLDGDSAIENYYQFQTDTSDIPSSGEIEYIIEILDDDAVLSYS